MKQKWNTCAVRVGQSFVLSFVLLTALVASASARADTDVMGRTWLLPEIKVEESTPVETLSLDPTLPVVSGKSNPSGARGSLENALFNQIALPTTNNAEPGTISQFRGAGRSVTDTEVQALGISLNPPAGGGLDLSTLPQYLWSDFEYQMGPALGAFDLRANSGTLILTPWTESALNSAESSASGRVMSSSAGVTQTAAGADWGRQGAILAGYSGGTATGPSASLSTRWNAGPLRGKFHVLGSQIEAPVPGSLSYPTPDARQVSTRVLPVLQADADVGEGILKTSAFYDVIDLDNTDPGTKNLYPGESQSNSRTRQGGVELAYLNGGFSLGAGARRTDYGLRSEYSGMRYDTDQAETATHASVGYLWQEGAFQLSPRLEGTSLSTYGFRPGASLGARYAFTPGVSTFLRGSSTYIFPGLLDRYYQSSSFMGDPNLLTERDWTLQTGVEGSAQGTQASFQLMYQLRQDAIVNPASGYGSPSNVGDATLGTALATVNQDLVSGFQAFTSASYRWSRVLQTGARFPYVPQYSQVVGLKWADSPETPKVQLRSSFRAVTESTVTSETDLLPGYGVLELGAQVRLAQVNLILQVEDALDRAPQFTKDYPSQGRLVSGGLQATF